MIPQRKLLPTFFMIAWLSVGLSGCANNVNAIEPNKRIVELEMGPVRGPVLTKLTAAKQDTLRLILPVDNPPEDTELPYWDIRPPWDIAIRTPDGHWFDVVNYQDDLLLLFDFEEFASLPYIDISIADLIGRTISKYVYSNEKVFREPGKYRISLEENFTRHIEGYESLEGQVILK